MIQDENALVICVVQSTVLRHLAAGFCQAHQNHYSTPMSQQQQYLVIYGYTIGRNRRILQELSLALITVIPPCASMC